MNIWYNYRGFTNYHLLPPPDIPEVNSIRAYLRMNFVELHGDALKEKQLLRKLGPGEERGVGQSVLATSLQFGMAIEFERSDPMRRFRLFLSEMLRVMSKVHIHCMYMYTLNP